MFQYLVFLHRNLLWGFRDSRIQAIFFDLLPHHKYSSPKKTIRIQYKISKKKKNFKVKKRKRKRKRKKYKKHIFMID